MENIPDFDKPKDSRLETPHLFPGYSWYLEALKQELEKPGGFPMWWEIDIRRGFCRRIRDELEAGNSVNVLAWEDARKFNHVSIPGSKEVNRNGDLLSKK